MIHLFWVGHGWVELEFACFLPIPYRSFPIAAPHHTAPHALPSSTAENTALSQRRRCYVRTYQPRALPILAAWRTCLMAPFLRSLVRRFTYPIPRHVPRYTQQPHVHGGVALGCLNLCTARFLGTSRQQFTSFGPSFFFWVLFLVWFGLVWS